jgi:hypothetical protein
VAFTDLAALTIANTMQSEERGELARCNADGFCNAISGNAPRFSRPSPLGAVLIPQQRAPRHNSSSPHPEGK